MFIWKNLVAKITSEEMEDVHAKERAASHVHPFDMLPSKFSAIVMFYSKF
jgi:hypothetical protein